MVKVKPKVYFNASVVLAGFKSPNGGSGKLLLWAKQGRIKGIISEIILDEVLRNAAKIGFDRDSLSKKVKQSVNLIKAPAEKWVDQYKDLVVHLGDAHVLASSQETGIDYLVTLDQKHLLSLKDQIKEFKIVSPGQLISYLANN